MGAGKILCPFFMVTIKVVFECIFWTSLFYFEDMRIYHITSPASAISILESGKFRPTSDNPLNFDSGLNSFRFSAVYQGGQNIRSGARLVMEWAGPVVVGPAGAFQMAPGTLYDQYPWRCFIPNQTIGNMLRIVAIRFDQDEIEDMISIPVWHKLLPEKYRKVLYGKARLTLMLKIRREYRNQNRILHVIHN